MIVHVGSVLLSYTGNQPDVEAEGGTLAAIFDDLDRRYPGLKFRVIDEQGEIRPHMNVFVGGRPTRSMRAKVAAGAEVHVLQALSGG